MEAIILAAGMGKRLLPLTLTCPKCLVEIFDETIFERIINNCLPYGINHFSVVIGHGKEAMYHIKKELEIKYSVTITYLENVNYNITNTGVSLSIALEHVKDDVIIINGDNVFDKRIIGEISLQNASSIVIDNMKSLNEESFKVRYMTNKIELMGKNIPVTRSNGEFIGISKINKHDIGAFKRILERMIKIDKNVYYDFTFQKLSFIQPLTFVLTNGLRWTEIDTMDDLANAKNIIKDIELEKTI